MEQEKKKIKAKLQKTKKKLIIESSSSSSSLKKSFKKTKKKAQQQTKKDKPEKAKHKIKPKQQTKKRKLIIASSTTSEIENKNENKTDLNISEQITKMPVTIRLNEKFIDLMEQLANIMLKQGEPFRARAYQKAQETIMAHPTDILSPDDLKSKPNIGATIMEKLNEYVQTGTLKVLEREKNNPVNILADVYGIGPKKAKELVDKGVTTIAALRANQDTLLNETQKVGLKYYDDILKRIPRSEIEEYKSLFLKAQEEEAKMEIVGSYRRGAESSVDIDVIITSNNPAIFTNFVDSLIKTGVIQEVLSRGPTKCLVITKLPNKETSRRVDFLYTTPEEFPFAILYFTGSKIFNTVMRHEALAKELTMNEHGLYSLVGKKKGEKVNHIFRTEKDIFDYLGLEYKAPHERTDGRAIIKASESKATESKATESVQSAAESKAEEAESKAEEEESKAESVIEKNIKNFKKNGITVLQGLNENQLTEMLSIANILYRNLQPIMTDNEYDILQDYITEKYPSNQEVYKIGAPVEKNKAQLPYEMGSMDKIKPDTSALSNWTKKYPGPYVLSCKLDGVSGLYSTEEKIPKLYTRGDGKVGQDVSHLIPHLRLPKSKGIVIRGEFIIPKSIFTKKYLRIREIWSPVL